MPEKIDPRTEQLAEDIAVAIRQTCSHLFGNRINSQLKDAIRDRTITILNSRSRDGDIFSFTNVEVIEDDDGHVTINYDFQPKFDLRWIRASFGKEKEDKRLSFEF